jgi:hypothetical protein
MNPAPQAQSAPDARLAGGLINLVQQLQKNRFSGERSLQGAPIGGEAQAEPQKFEALLNEVSPNGQKQDAARAPGTLQKEGGEEGGRQRNVGQGETEGGPGKSPQVPSTEEKQQKRRMS